MTRAVVLAGVVVALVLGARAFVAEPMQVASASMAPTLADGDHVLVDKRAGAPGRDDLVVFGREGELLIKRVVAVGGDTVGIEDGRLVVNGRGRSEPYAPPEAQDGVWFGPVRVRSGSVFVLGDNRADSLDSRAFGAIPIDRVVGRVAARLWPPGRLAG